MSNVFLKSRSLWPCPLHVSHTLYSFVDRVFIGEQCIGGGSDVDGLWFRAPRLQRLFYSVGGGRILESI
uniref:Uncharacterized protein n=1 Tax=Sinocyclocheilus grahami TaxID=75366 RepID=A0A672LYZ8_SINGR